jgi:hypothetical protein
MLAILDNVRALIERLAGEPICDDCVVEKLILPRPSQANLAMRELGGTNGFERRIDVCSLCGGERKVTRRIGK